MTLPLSSRGKSRCYKFHTRLGRLVRREEEKDFSFGQNSNSKPLAVEPLASRYIDCAILAPCYGYFNI
jgi:hypothetical protein